MVPDRWHRIEDLYHRAARCLVTAPAAVREWSDISSDSHQQRSRIVDVTTSSEPSELGVAAALVVFTAHRIELLREAAADARKLGQYVLKDRLGAGGMGEVYLAEHTLLRRPCAVKLVRRDRAGDPQHLRRFEREVRLTAALTHPNTVQVFDYGHTADGTFYYVMEYLDGLTLEDIVRRYGPLPSRRVVYLLRQVCAALGEAHGVGLIHRDIKPGNVRVCERGGRYDTSGA